jgi:Undecaprenyl pyrophosphate synthetase (EC 2.5.1.31)
VPTLQPPVSSTQSVPDSGDTPRHVAIIMDGNGRWAKKRLLPRVAGHRKGVEALRGVIRACAERGIGHLTVFAFSSENWRRPADEVSLLMELFMRALENEVAKLHENGIRFRMIGDLAPFSARIQTLIREAEALTAHNTRLTFTVAANYGGRWDVLQAVRKLIASGVAADAISEADLAAQLCLADMPEPDLFIRTGGEQRISNFLLWQLAYTELCFSDALWPDFDAAALDAAIASYRRRERRFGRTSEQLRNPAGSP